MMIPSDDRPCGPCGTAAPDTVGRNRRNCPTPNVMAHIHELIADLDGLLQPAGFRDLGPNGLQVPGAPEVTHLVTGVSARRALCERAVALNAQLVLVHHGLFWDFQPTGL